MRLSEDRDEFKFGEEEEEETIGGEPTEEGGTIGFPVAIPTSIDTRGVLTIVGDSAANESDEVGETCGSTGDSDSAACLPPVSPSIEWLNPRFSSLNVLIISLHTGSSNLI